MKRFKSFVYVIGIAALIFLGFYGYYLYQKVELKKQLAEAKVLYENGDIATAVDLWEATYKKYPNSDAGEESAYMLAKSYLNINELQKSKSHWLFLQGRNKEKYGAECLFNLAGIAKSTGETNIAIGEYEQLINEYPNSELVDDAMLNLAIVLREQGNLQEAQNKLMEIEQKYPSSNLINIVQDELGKINVGILFSAKQGEGTTEYVVKTGDSLFTIAQEFGTTVELIKKCNNLKSDFIKPGDKLRVLTEKFSIIVDKSKNIMTLKSGERVVKVYRVGTGIGGCTPAGTFVITNKLVNPPWHKPGEGVIPFGDKRNVLGTRWMGFNKTGYGIHGTWEPESVGKQASAGCVRLVNSDVDELFEIVPVGTEVTILE